MPIRMGPVEIILILVIIFIIFGAGKLPQLFEMFGRGLRVFRKEKKGGDRQPQEVKRRPPGVS